MATEKNGLDKLAAEAREWLKTADSIPHSVAGRPWNALSREYPDGRQRLDAIG